MGFGGVVEHEVQSLVDRVLARRAAGASRDAADTVAKTLSSDAVDLSSAVASRVSALADHYPVAAANRAELSKLIYGDHVPVGALGRIGKLTEQSNGLHRLAVALQGANKVAPDVWPRLELTAAAGHADAASMVTDAAKVSMLDMPPQASDRQVASRLAQIVSRATPRRAVPAERVALAHPAEKIAMLDYLKHLPGVPRSVAGVVTGNQNAIAALTRDLTTRRTPLEWILREPSAKAQLAAMRIDAHFRAALRQIAVP